MRVKRLLGFWSVALVALGSSAGAMTSALTPSVSSPAPVGTIVHWNVSVTGANSANNWYRFRARRTDSAFSIIRDYGPESALDWTAPDREGIYEVEASTMNLDNGDIAVATSTFQMLPVATGNHSVVSPTSEVRMTP